jgi:hypothetical protein
VSPSEACTRNAALCDSVGCTDISRMWRVLSMLLLPDNSPASLFRSIYRTTIKSVLQERLDIGDVQSAVYACIAVDVFQLKVRASEVV